MCMHAPAQLDLLQMHLVAVITIWIRTVIKSKNWRWADKISQPIRLKKATWNAWRALNGKISKEIMKIEEIRDSIYVPN